MTPHADDIADCVLSAFDRLPEKRKPRPRSDGSREWIPLAGIVLAKDGNLLCASLGTGMKCLPTNKLSQANGNVLHDWHAEVVALRAFNRFLVDECLTLLNPQHTPSRFLAYRGNGPSTDTTLQPFSIQDDVRIHMYCSEAPCGDASMELVMDAQEDATPWTSPPPTISSSGDSLDIEATALRGRSHFGLLGAVRLKPSRPDAPPTLSKSCTDKIALTQCTSLLSSLSSMLISPRNAYLTSLVLPKSQYVESACMRAFGSHGRMSSLMSSTTINWSAGYTFKPFEVKSVTREFMHSRRSIKASEKAVPCNLSAVYTPHFQETLIGGALQGRKQFDPRGASRLCRRAMWRAAVEVASLAALPKLASVLNSGSYAQVKGCQELSERRKVKEDVKREVLKGWVSNPGDEDFMLET